SSRKTAPFMRMVGSSRFTRSFPRRNRSTTGGEELHLLWYMRHLMDIVTLDEHIADLFRHQASRVLARLARLLGPQRFDEAENILQETLIKAMTHWGYHGVPQNPGGWLMAVAQRHALDVLRHEHAHPTVDLLDAGDLVAHEHDVSLLDHDIHDDLV